MAMGIKEVEMQSAIQTTRSQGTYCSISDHDIAWYGCKDAST